MKRTHFPPVAQASRLHGFTLIELLIVIAIIAILSGLILGGLAAARRTTKISLTQGRFQLLKSALERYEHDWDDYPPSGGDEIRGAAALYECLRTDQKGGPYVKDSDMPSGSINANGDVGYWDAWEKPIYYLHHRDYHNQPPNKREFRLLSAGPNMQYENGTKESDDIVNWVKEKANEQ